MGKLEIREYFLSDLERSHRLDAEFYSKENQHVLNVLNKLSIKTISDVALVSDGNHMSISEQFCNEGISYYRGQDVHSFFIEQANPICIDEGTYNKSIMLRSHLKKGDVLLSIVGTIGEVSLVTTSNKATCSCKLAILRPNNIDENYLAIYLSSKFGRSQIKKFTRGAVQMGFLLEDMNQIYIPIFPESFQSSIADMVKKAHACLEESKTLYKEAEKLLENELGIDDELFSKKDTVESSVRSFSSVFHDSARIDAEYYQNKYDEYESLIKKYKGGWDLVQNKFNQNKNTLSFSKTEYNYIEIGDIDTSNGSCNYNKVKKEELPANARILVSKGDLLISKVRPYRGAVSIIDFEQEDFIASGAFTVLQKKTDYLLETLQILLRTSLYKDWMLKWNVGTSYPVIKDENILELPIPILPSSIQVKIAEKIQHSFELRKQSKQLLEDAKRMVEEEIEK